MIAFGSPFRKAVAHIDGLTCSMCSMSVEKALRKLGFVSNVEMDLNENRAEISFVEGEAVALAMIARQVKEAGFSLRDLTVEVTMDSLEVKNQQNVILENVVYQFRGVEPRKLEGSFEFQVLGEDFMSRKDWKSWKEECSKEVRFEAMKSFPGVQGFYFVTL